MPLTERQKEILRNKVKSYTEEEVREMVKPVPQYIKDFYGTRPIGNVRKSVFAKDKKT